VKHPHNKTAESRQTESTTPPADRGLTFREVSALLGSKCKTAHTALAYAKRGKIRRIDITARTVRYSEASVLALIAGRAEA
jgi:hypothetical protein